MITQSYLNTKKITNYAIKRGLRILPALILSVLLVTLVIGPILTKLSLKEYLFSVDRFSPIGYAFYSLTFNLFGYEGLIQIRDLFLNNPYPQAVNGSMWTLKYEIIMYLLLPVFFIFKKNKKNLLIILFLLLLLFLLLNVYWNYRLLNISDNFWPFGVEYQQSIMLSLLFLGGSIMYNYKDQIVVNKLIIFILAMITILFSKTRFLMPLIAIFLPYIVVSINVLIKKNYIKRIGDLSCGVYMYSFPIQQSLVSVFGNKITYELFLLMTYLLVFLMSFFSWHLIEKNALKIKSRLNN